MDIKNELKSTYLKLVDNLQFGGDVSKFRLGGIYLINNTRNNYGGIFICYKIDKTTNPNAYLGKEIRFLKVNKFPVDVEIDKKFYFKIYPEYWIDLTRSYAFSYNDLNGITEGLYTLDVEKFKKLMDKYFQYILNIEYSDMILQIKKMESEYIFNHQNEFIQKIVENNGKRVLEIMQAKYTAQTVMEDKHNFDNVESSTESDSNDKINPINDSENETEEVTTEDLKSPFLTVSKPKKSLKKRKSKFSHIKDKKEFYEEYKGLKRINSKKIDPEELEIFKEINGLEHDVTVAEISKFICLIRKELNL